MKKLIKRIDLRLLNLSAWITLLLAYVMPLKHVEGFEFQAGFPFHFMSIYKDRLENNIFKSININLGDLIIDIALIYIVLLLIKKLFYYFKIKKER